MSLCRWRGAALVVALACASTSFGQDRIRDRLPERPDRILIEKAERRLTLLRGDRALKVYRVALGGSPAGDKQCQGDNRTPEGVYRISGRNPHSAYHRSLRISYPDAKDRAEAKRRGCSPGGDIYIHGLPNGRGAIGGAHRLRDWTLGCIAVTDPEIEEIWRLVPDGTAVEIRP
jgi:murein L,D-transpeptidase YafK